MSFFRGPKIVNNGLILFLDAANIKSYNGTMIWYDLSGNGNNVSLINSPSYNPSNKGNIVFDSVSSNYFITPSINFRTICMWIKTPKTGKSYKYLLDARTGMNTGWYSVGGIGASWVLQYINGQQTTVSFSNITPNTWCYVTIISDNNYTDDISFACRYSKTEFLDVNISTIKIYNRVLTSTEVLQNYNATKSRYII